MLLAQPAHAELCVLIHNPGEDPIWSRQHEGGSAPQHTEPSAWYVKNPLSYKQEFSVSVTRNGITTEQDISLGGGDFKKLGNANRVRIDDKLVGKKDSIACKAFFAENHWTWVDHTTVGVVTIGIPLILGYLIGQPTPTTPNGTPCSNYTGAAQQNCIGGFQNRQAGSN